MTRITLALVATFLAGAAQAEGFLCRFVTECYGKEACADTDYEAEMTQFGDIYILEDVAGRRGMMQVSDKDGHRALVSGNVDGTSALMTITADGQVIYTQHGLTDPAWQVTYHGTCEAK
ncbi:hypothetical protein VK792_05605 [Mesobacterium sp. TK19101]|uniref:Uncharacterized protein n=1 Tax=Mesobacterium hydrothermale TaxID=3111907 RepID=A0ABU6HE74_9RHOB|nr:hypothetical protein [Mesobacterium sp. TK19101]MEC3860752.1 hypothetical protein [Mesobacterium sp. TK19101]